MILVLAASLSHAAPEPEPTDAFPDQTTWGIPVYAEPDLRMWTVPEPGQPVGRGLRRDDRGRPLVRRRPELGWRIAAWSLGGAATFMGSFAVISAARYSVE